MGYQKPFQSGLRETRAVGDREKLADAIYLETGVSCEVRIDATHVCIVTKDYADYVLAKKVAARFAGEKTVVRSI